jgi:hypothetical protein
MRVGAFGRTETNKSRLAAVAVKAALQAWAPRIRVEGCHLIARREGSHATTAAAAPSAAGLSGPFDILVHNIGCARRITESSGIARPEAAGLHLMPQSDVRAMFLPCRMMQARRFACCIPRHGRCGDDESGGGKCDDDFLHFQSSMTGIKSPRGRSRHLLYANSRRFSFSLLRSMRDICNCTC